MSRYRVWSELHLYIQNKQLWIKAILQLFKDLLYAMYISAIFDLQTWRLRTGPWPLYKARRFCSSVSTCLDFVQATSRSCSVKIGYPKKIDPIKGHRTHKPRIHIQTTLPLHQRIIRWIRLLVSCIYTNGYLHQYDFVYLPSSCCCFILRNTYCLFRYNICHATRRISTDTMCVYYIRFVHMHVPHCITEICGHWMCKLNDKCLYCIIN
jgi:hypothetical protein